MAINTSLKRLQIDKAKSNMVAVIAVAVFITIFSLASSKTLFSEMQYQNRVATAKQMALNKLRDDIVVANQLRRSYNSFNSKSPNYIGDSTATNVPPDVNNARLVLDALPSQYDFPALTSSIQYLLNSSGVRVDSIGGTDAQASGGSSATVSTAAPTTTTVAAGDSVAMPFQFDVDSQYSNIQNLFSVFERSIRPMAFQTISISGDQSDLTLTATLQSYYQPATNFNISTETIK